MNDHPSASGHVHEKFSLPLFALTVLATLAVLFAALRFLAPSVWDAQLASPLWKLAAVFVAVSLLNCFVEYFFHRYVLHSSAVPFLRRFYRQHTLHHGLTHIVRRPLRDNSHVLVIENKFPMVEPGQHEASFFPWYTLAVFAALLAPLFALLHLLVPSFPWFVGGLLALACSLTLYELLHALNHWPLDTWLPLIEHPRWGRFWRPVYGFHLRHHAVIDCNESISGFFGLPVADWVFGTCLIPRTVYAQGEISSPEKFLSPRPCRFIRWLDDLAVRAVHQRRAAAVAASASAELPEMETSSARLYTRGEEAARWLTHGLGLALGIVSLTLLIVFAGLRGDAWHVVSFSVFGLTLLLLHTATTLHHGLRGPRATRRTRSLVHAGIFLLIAGTYTPFMLVSLRGPWGWSLFGVIWGLCGAGAVFQLLFGHRFKFTSPLAYVFLGWLILVAIRPLAAAVPPGGLWLLLAGGLCYALGAVFYRWQRMRYHHAFWNTFVTAGGACHCLAVLLFLLPHRA